MTAPLGIPTGPGRKAWVGVPNATPVGIPTATKVVTLLLKTTAVPNASADGILETPIVRVSFGIPNASPEGIQVVATGSL
jgi:hypothetical protein